MRKKHGSVPKLHICSGLDSHNEQKHWHSKCPYKRNSGSPSAGTNNPTRWGWACGATEDWRAARRRPLWLRRQRPPLWHPRCQFRVCREICPNLGCSAKISISLSHLSPFIKLIVNVSPNLELFDLKNSQIWSLLKLLFLGAKTNSKVNLVSQLPSRLFYSDSWQLWYYPIYVWIRCLDSRFMSKYIIRIRILQQNLCCANL
jgi:hypothetical protein